MREAHRHFGEQRGERRAVRLVVPEIVGFLPQPREHLIDLPLMLWN
jgi:hypothetical protein